MHAFARLYDLFVLQQQQSVGVNENTLEGKEKLEQKNMNVVNYTHTESRFFSRIPIADSIHVVKNYTHK